MGVTPIDDNDADGKSDKLYGWLLIIRCNSDESSNDSDSKANTTTYNSDLSYIYYKGKSLNINIYHKQTELEKRQLECDLNIDYNFLRIKVQVKKSKLNTLVSKFGLKGKELQYLVTPEVERYVLEYYETD